MDSNSSLVTPKEPLSEVGFEPTPPFGDQKPQQLRSLATRKEPLSEVGFEPTPPFGDQKSQQLRRLKYLESGALDRSAILTLTWKYVIDNSITGVEVGFEPTPPIGDQKSQQLRRLKHLESGALDHSATLILTDEAIKDNSITGVEPLSEVGFEPTPPFGDQKSQQLRRLKYLESGALDRSAILTLA
ncbi:hypothetical protein QQF64_016649 [Cirrhinus molitorella]|uniref:Uncharacterized protein n=1 Tax=Cirrhinus molitorella TaxID=172907 RepID=A0ABR3LND2_9TELE